MSGHLNNCFLRTLNLSGLPSKVGLSFAKNSFNYRMQPLPYSFRRIGLCCDCSSDKASWFILE